MVKAILAPFQTRWSILACSTEVCSHAKDIGKIDKKSGFILPGVGAFNIGMQEMKKRKLDTLVRDMVEKG